MRVLPHFRKNQLVAVHRFTFGTKECCKVLIFIVLVLALPARGLSQWIDEGEFSQAVLSYKLCQLKTQFEQAEAELSMRRGESKLKKLELEDVYRRIIRLESEFQRGGYYPDLLDEQIVILREDLRLILADPGQTGITEPLLL